MTERELLEQAATRVRELAAAAQLQVHVEVIADDTESFDGEIRVDFNWSIGWDAEQGNEEAWSSYRVVHYAATRHSPAEEDFQPGETGYLLDQIAADVLSEVVADRIRDFREREREQELLEEQEDSSR